MSNEIRSWADEHQYDQEEFSDDMYHPKSGVLPRVHLVSMTADPLGAVAAACRMYEGKGTTDLSQITDEERRHYWQQSQATHLKAPLEYVDFHFFIEGVDRAFTHQMVRQRTAVFSQESMRFAVVDDLPHRTTLPPSLYGTEESKPDSLPTGQREQNRYIWDDAVRHVQSAYQYLVNNGMPAEEARGLLPHATATRLNYHTNLRNLLDHAGNRLCTQAQFHWRLVFSQMAQAISEYNPDRGGLPRLVSIDDNPLPDRRWQFRELSKVFKPVCYQLGHCPFNASFDRSCTIRERVQENAKHGVPSSEWEDDHAASAPNEPRNDAEAKMIPAIHNSEWALDPAAARKARQ